MRARPTWFTLLWALGGALAGSRAIAAPPLEAFGRLPSIEDVALSPDGTKLAFIRTTADQRLLAVMQLADQQVLFRGKVGEAKLRDLEWADDRHLLLTTASSSMPMELDGERQEWHLMQVFDLRTQHMKPLLEHADSRDTRTMNVVYGRPVVLREGPDTVVFLHGEYVNGDRMSAALFKVNLTTGSEFIVKRGREATEGWLIDDDGTIVAEQAYVERARRWEIDLIHNGHVQQTVSGTAPIDTPGMLGLTADGGAIVTALTEDRGIVWRTLLLKDGSWGEDVEPGARLTDLVLPAGRQRMIGTAELDDDARYHFLDPALEEGWKWVVRVFGGDRVECVSLSADRSRMVVLVLGPKHGYGYYLADLAEHLTEPVGQVYENVDRIAEIRRVNYPAGDGLTIPAYLTMPPGLAARNLPLIVMPHGGPQARDRVDFDWWAQALAAQGYAILQPNYRGSALDWNWVQAGFGEWGRKMQSDLSDGVRDLVKQGIADPNRVCIVGASYGGYAALAGVTLESGVYRCAVAVSGVADLASFAAWVRRAHSEAGLRYVDRFLGIDGPGDRRLDAISPIKHADRIGVPVLLIHGRDDVTVPYEQSADMAKAIKRAGKSVEFISLAKEDHFMSRSATRVQMLQASIEFLRRNNPAGEPSPTAKP